ncbi:hypothetical protein DL95DRAFT_393158 [Leptodontidium sp. 2 PMI_412]|nr:hypothetical protein DL95DRAFT_393158 [Leptodontidium sp. 2 PMI_412]
MSRSLNPGSCESCKRKKCKCDRKLPICGQCAGVVPAISCTYAESNRRGIPGGYVGALEARLIETEIALYKTICSLRSSSANPALDLSRSSSETLPEALLQHEQGNESKVLKMAMWKRLPLSTVEEVQSWWDTLRAESGMVCTRHKSSLTLRMWIIGKSLARNLAGRCLLNLKMGHWRIPMGMNLFKGRLTPICRFSVPFKAINMYLGLITVNWGFRHLELMIHGSMEEAVLF